MKTMLAVVLDLLLSPFALLAAALLRWIRSRGFRRFRRCAGACRMVGLLPITDHYYEPYYDPHGVDKQAFEQLRSLPGIDLNEAGQLEFLSCLRHGNELPRQQKNRPPSAVNSYSYSSITFGPGEADYYYCVVRAHKPRRIVEIGSGSSTLVALQAIEANRRDDPGYTCAMTCIEPYENEWLDELGSISVVRQPVEQLDFGVFERLEPNDILFVDSSHAIRPNGDVLFEHLQVLPRLRSGVLVHIHDIYTPGQYPYDYLYVDGRLWNEQYLVEGFLSHNSAFEIIGALNFLQKKHFRALAERLPIFKQYPNADVGSLWLRRK